MNTKKYLITKRQVKMLAEAEINKLKNLEGMAGGTEDRHIEYPSAEDVAALDIDMDTASEYGAEPTKPKIDQSLMVSPPHELLAYLDKIEDAKSILSKVAAREKDENIKSRIYVHYEKAQKLAFELIKEFGIVH